MSPMDLLYRSISDYAKGIALVSFTRMDRHSIAVVRYELAFDTANSPGLSPDPRMLDELMRLFDLAQRGTGILSLNQSMGQRVEFVLEISAVHAFNPPNAPVQYPTVALPKTPFPITYNSPPPKEKKKPTVARKIRTEVEVGYRDFTYLKKGNPDRPMLLSRNGVPWPRYAPLVASCGGDPFAKHDAPHLDCECGIYAFNRPDAAELKTDAAIWGEIALWGKVFICPNGFRAEYAYPQNIFVKDVGTRQVRRFALALEEEYGVPTHLVKEREGKKASELLSAMIHDLLGR